MRKGLISAGFLVLLVGCSTSNPQISRKEIPYKFSQQQLDSTKEQLSMLGISPTYENLYEAALAFDKNEDRILTDEEIRQGIKETRKGLELKKQFLDLADQIIRN